MSDSTAYIRSSLLCVALTARVLSTPNTAVRTEKGIVSTVMRPASTVQGKRERVSERREARGRSERTLRDIKDVIDDKQ